MYFQYNTKRDNKKLLLSYSGYKFSTQASIKFLNQIKNLKTFKYLINNFEEELINYYFIKLFYESFKVIGHQYTIKNYEKRISSIDKNFYYKLTSSCHSEYPYFNNIYLLRILFPDIYYRLSKISIFYMKLNNLLNNLKNKIKFIKDFFKKKKFPLFKNKNYKIGILYGEGIDLKKRSDIYWVSDFKYDKKDIILYFTNPRAFSSSDKKNINDEIKKIGINFINIWEYNFNKNTDLIKSLNIFLNSNKFNEINEKWLNIQAINLVKKIQYWYNVYDHFSIKINQDPYESGLDPIIRQIAIKKFGGCGINRVRTYWGYEAYESTGMYPSDIFFCWGQDSANKIIKSYNPNKNLILTGFPYNDIIDLNYLKKID